MNNPIIRVEHLSKKYMIGHQPAERYTALRDVIASGFKSIKNRWSGTVQHPSSKEEEFWALNDVSFEVNQGDRIGIIGRNGAGKSTLLKILSRITEPTAGRIRLKGRVASLLEVGTGFHPELTGRENIYLNGAILGMGKIEIRQKFDEIVAFAEVEQFLDTPVKRYSSGMYVRLAFAVAAHLEPEILVVDEVLAVGDASFQKKCLGKMRDVGEEGRTVLFVSHNMGTVQQLCNQCFLLEHGCLTITGSPDHVIAHYLANSSKGYQEKFIRKGNQKARFENIRVTDADGVETTTFFMGDTIQVHFCLHFHEKVEFPVIAVQITNSINDSFAHMINIDDDCHVTGDPNKVVSLSVELKDVFFSPSVYFISLWVGENMMTACDHLMDCISIEMLQGDRLRRLSPYPPHFKVFLPTKWTIDHEAIIDEVDSENSSKNYRFSHSQSSNS